MPPNMIFIMCDDHAARAISAYRGGLSSNAAHRPLGHRGHAPRRRLRHELDLHALARRHSLRHP